MRKAAPAPGLVPPRLPELGRGHGSATARHGTAAAPRAGAQGSGAHHASRSGSARASKRGPDGARAAAPGAVAESALARQPEQQPSRYLAPQGGKSSPAVSVGSIILSDSRAGSVAGDVPSDSPAEVYEQRCEMVGVRPLADVVATLSSGAVSIAALLPVSIALSFAVCGLA